jgi:hypothetical protein
MKDKHLIATAKDFRDGMLDGDSSEFMCRAVCLPLAGFFSFLGVDLEVIECDVDCGDYGVYHTCLRLPDQRILDPTADQFPLGLPPVYLGPMPKQYGFMKVLE